MALMKSFMEIKKIKIDFSVIGSISQLHEELQKKFGFPSFYGKNIYALIDCLSSLRYPEDQMSEIVLDHKDDILLLEIIDLSKKDEVIINNFLIAIETVNRRMITKNQTCMIYLSPICT